MMSEHKWRVNHALNHEPSAIAALAAEVSPYSALSHHDEEAFDAAMRECDAWHQKHNPVYPKLWVDERRPTIPVGLFKRVDLGTPVEAEGMWLSSSGTSKTTATNVFFDEVSMARIKPAMLQIFIQNRFVDLAPANFLLLSPKPEHAKGTGYATAFDKFTACAPIHERVYCVSKEGAFQPQLAWDTLKRWSEQKGTDRPRIFIFGLTVYFEQLVLAADKPISGLPTIKALTGGGWKGLTQNLPRSVMVDRLRTLLGAAKNGADKSDVDIRDMFGLTEHALHYLSCPFGRFHLPKYSRFQIIGPGPEGELPPGEVGLIRLMKPFFAGLPSHDLLTEDLGVWGQTCDCGSPLPFLEFRGRATSSRGTCAFAATKVRA
jgi:hypothetical protein